MNINKKNQSITPKEERDNTKKVISHYNNMRKQIDWDEDEFESDDCLFYVWLCLPQHLHL